MSSETYGSRALVVAFLLLFVCLIQLFHWDDELLQRSEEKTLSSPMSTLDAPALDVTFDILVEDTVSLDSSTSLLTSAETNSDLLIFPYPKVVQVAGGGGGQRQQVGQVSAVLRDGHLSDIS